MRGDRVGVVGANGAGKTTLIELLSGALAPDSGAVRLGANVAMAKLDQRRASLEPTTTLSDALTGGGTDYVLVNGERKHVVGYMKDFLFSPEQARTPIGKLSGGERGRLTLARALAQPSNLMVLDEPTNDLDLETLELLQELLGDYAGTILLVSHDRDFLDRVATSVVAAEGDGRWREYAGGYSDLVAQRGYGLSGAPVAEAPKPEKAPAREAAERPAAKRKLSFNQKRALELLPGGSRRCATRSPRWRRSSATSICTAAIRPASTARRTPTPTSAPNWSAPRTNGSRWRFCARSSKLTAQPNPVMLDIDLPPIRARPTLDRARARANPP